MPSDREIGASIGDYRLVRKIGSGASGEVFEAEHILTRRHEAIKFLRPGAEAETAVLREIEIQAGLQHPNIAAVHNAFRTGEGLALVMELVDGEPLQRMLERGGVPLRTGIGYLLQTLDALAYAHGHGVVHRDVKPANIIVAGGKTVKLTDFGLAQSANDRQNPGSGTLAGSPYYISPEQIAGLLPADARSDCYSAGVVLYEIATGRRPFEGESAFEVMLQHREANPAPPIDTTPAIGPALNDVILKALEKEPVRRFQSAVEFRAALEAAMAKAGQRRGRWAAAAAVAGLAAASAMLAPLRHRTPPIPAVPPKVQPAPAVLAPVPSPEAAKPDPVEVAPVVDPPPPRPRTRKQPVATVRAPAAAPTPPEVSIESKEERPPAAPPVAIDALPEPQRAAPGLSFAVPIPEAPQPSEPAKRPGVLRRVFGKIARPFSGKPSGSGKQ